jgi:hypothetical protein
LAQPLHRSAVPQEGKKKMSYTITFDDERREPMGLTETDRCRLCRGAITRTDASGLCWSCMPCA